MPVFKGPKVHYNPTPWVDNGFQLVPTPRELRDNLSYGKLHVPISFATIKNRLFPKRGEGEPAAPPRRGGDYRTNSRDEFIYDASAMLSCLAPSEQETIEALLIELGRKGYLPFPFARKLKGVEKLWELRPGRHRVIYFYYQGNKAVLLHAFKKQSQKTPEKEIEVARQRMSMITRGGV